MHQDSSSDDGFRSNNHGAPDSILGSLPDGARQSDEGNISCSHTHQDWAFNPNYKQISTYIVVLFYRTDFFNKQAMLQGIQQYLSWSNIT